jgi:ribonucleotide monophosphatase NagD (HAD superfamily)
MLEYASGMKAIDFGRGSIGLYNMALRYMQVGPGDVVAVGTQFPKDIETARKIGIETVYLTNGSSIMELGMDEENHPDYIVEDLYGLTR